MTARLVLPVVLALGCVTTPNVSEKPAPAPQLPGPVTVVPTRVDPETVLERVEARATFAGFGVAVPPYREPGGGPDAIPSAARIASRATLDLLDRERHVAATKDLEGCWGETEVLQVRSLPSPSGSEVRVSCHTERLEVREGACERRLEAGCPGKGDRLVGDIAMDLTSI